MTTPTTRPTSRAATVVAGVPLALCAAVAALTTVAALALITSQFRPVLVLPLGLLAAAAAAAVVFRVMPATPTRTLLPNLLVLVGALVCVGFNLKYSAQEIWVFRDPSTYALTGEWLAHHATAFIHTQPDVFGSVPGVGDTSLGFGRLSPGTIQSQYPDAAPMLVAIGGWFSDSALLRVAPLIGGVALLGFYALVRSVVTEWWALGATALLAVSLPMLNFSRAVYSEPTTMVFLLGGLALLFLCDEVGGWPVHVVTGVTFGAAEIARLDGGLYLLAVSAYAVMRLARAVDRRAAVREVAALAGAAVLVFLLGVLMTRRLSPLYWAGHDKETVGLLAPAVLVALVGAVVVLLAWGPPERRTKALALVPRTAWTVAGIVVLLGIFGATRPFWLVHHHFVRADFTIAEEILQKAKHIRVDGTRDYAENSMTWIGWYYGAVVVAAGVIGAAWLVLRFGRTGKPALVAFLLVFLSSSVLFLWYPNIAPDQIWVMRRFLPIVIPGFVIAAAYVGHRLGLLGRPAQVVAAVLVVASFGFAIDTSQTLARVRQAVPELAEVENVCANLPANAALLVSGELADTYAMTARAYCRVPVATLKAPTQATLATVAATARAHGKTLMLLADNAAVLPAGTTPQPVSTLVIESWNTTLQQPAQASGHPTRSMYLLAVGADGALTTPANQHTLTNIPS
ncbi:hypothetical protein acdb102_29240 [Acidothermaceae bacterium B102]|nr:hypothetical protein acdb102_29240 [Acidothermaceae bacterium B102]